MKENIKEKVRQVLDSYLEMSGHRKTPERYAILDACYSLGGHFTLDELGEKVKENNFRVSRATLYNTVKLFIELRLITRHNLQDGTKYEACLDNDNHVHQICTVCGKVTEVCAPLILQAVKDTKLKRFRKDGFTLYIYGICRSCQSKLTKRRMLEEKGKSKKPNKNEHR